MKSLNEMLAELQQKRDELNLHLHLASKEGKEEWENLVHEWERFLTAAQFDRSRDEVGDAAKELGLKMKDAFDRLKKAADK